MFDLEKAMSDIKKQYKEKSINVEYCLRHLKNKKVDNFTYRKYYVYNELLTRMYNYATSATDDHDDEHLIIGNVMRRVLEAFAAFSFRLSIEDLSLNERVLQLLPNEETKEYYQNSMYRWYYITKVTSKKIFKVILK
jgi:wobble nucleotide-excising tRNase